MKLLAALVLAAFCLTACDKRIREARVDQPTLSKVSHSGLTYSCPNS
jgi:hypothetical protein